MTQIKKVWEHTRTDKKTGRTEHTYTIFYDKAIKWYVPEEKLPMTVLKFILSDAVRAEVTKRYPTNKRTEYTPA